MILLICLFISPFTAHAGVPVPFTINLSETVIVTGTPRLQLDVGGVTRYAPYVSGSGTNALSFAYPVVAPDFDRNGITLVSPLDLNGGTIKDVNGNNATLTFTPPNTSGVRLQSYTVAWTTTPITPANASSAAFAVTGAPTGATFNYTITSDGGGTPVTGSGTITGTPHHVTGVNLNSLLSGTLTLSVTVTNATGTGNAKTNTVVATIFSGVLDSLPATAAAYSVRRLKSSYTGALMRVRRSNDNAEQDIGYAGNGDLDTTALTTFCGANSCFVKTWYDQSGNGRNATQTTMASQPRIVNSGTIDRSGANNKIALSCNSTVGLQANNVMLGNSDYSKNAVVTQISTSSYGNFLSGALGGSNSHAFFFSNTNFPNIWHSGSFAVGGSIPLNSQGIATAIFVKSTNTGSVYSNGALGSSGTNTTSFTDTGIMLCNYGAPSAAGGLIGFLAEANVFPSALSTPDRQTLENNQKAYYNIP